MTNLGELNTSRFFCGCGIGENGNCPAPHVERELAKPGSNARAMLILSIIAVAAFVMAFWRWQASF